MLDGTLGGELEAEYIVNVGTNIGVAVKAILQDAGEVKSPIISPITINTPYTLVKNPGDTYADLLIELAEMVSWEVNYDRNGYPRFQTPTNLDSTGSTWDYSTEEILYLGSQHKYEYTKIRNYIVVYGDNINGQLFRAVAQDNNAQSPTRVSLIGKRVDVITDDLIYTTSLAQQRADYELQKAIALIESVNMNSIPIDIIEGGNIITIFDESNGLYADRFLVNSVNFPLVNDGEMKLNVWKTRSFI